MKALAWTVAVFGMIAGSIKVYNELEMTKQYARWADASVRQAEALERAYPKPPSISEQITQMEFDLWLDKFMRKNNLPAKVKEVRLR